ncbi:MAG: thioredoxin [Chitinophagaceae bacterium]|nr:thioredoxin [Chitinophagaceae bacterium]
MTDEQKDILEASYQTPVLVDFWAPWCGPCRMIGPVLEELHREANGKWKLIKVNTDEQPELMYKYGIRGIPALKLFYEGKIIGEQVGALPKHLLKRWLNDILPTPEKKEWETLQAELNNLSDEEAIGKLEDFLSRYPEHPEALPALLQRKVFSAPEEIKSKTEALIKKQGETEILTDLLHLSEFLTTPYQQGTPVDGLLAEAANHLKNGNPEQAVEALIQSIMLNKNAYDQIARKVCIALFHRWGHNHPFTEKYRSRFAMALY